MAARAVGAWPATAARNAARVRDVQHDDRVVAGDAGLAGRIGSDDTALERHLHDALGVSFSMVESGPTK
jgi:hypothetical protein